MNNKMNGSKGQEKSIIIKVVKTTSEDKNHSNLIIHDSRLTIHEHYT